MFETRLVTTSSEGLRALGQKEQRSFELITDVVRDRLGDEHALIFGEAVPTQHGDQYDWYAAVTGKSEKLSALDEVERTRVRATLDRLTKDIEGEAERLLTSKDVNDVRLGEALQNAVRVPNDDFIYAVDTSEGLKPVLVNWAWVGDEQRAVRGVLTGQDGRVRAVERPPQAASALPLQESVGQHPDLEQPAPQSARGLGWLWWLIGLGWLLLTAILIAILLLLVKPCALNGVLGWNFCPVEVVQLDPFDDTAGLENQVAALERELAALDRSCQPPVTPRPAPEERVEPVETPAVDDELADRMERSGAQRGDLTFTLSWDTTSDLDLWVTCPAGSTISYRNRSNCGGFLDVDSNAGQVRSDPIENTYYNDPGLGSYYVRVNLYSLRNSLGPQSFTLTIQDGGHYETYNGTVSRQQPDWTVTYAYRGAHGTRSE